jgi:dTDP-glucose 4,6-dehydratase
VSDQVEGLFRLFMQGDEMPVNIGNPDEFTVRELADLVLELAGSTSPIECKPLPEDDPRVRQPDITRARDLLGWSPEVGLQAGLARTIEWFNGARGARGAQG